MGQESAVVCAADCADGLVVSVGDTTGVFTVSPSCSVLVRPEAVVSLTQLQLPVCSVWLL